ncbi:ABC transporter ATP-binding protein [Ancylobacter sp. WKF20]|uniref:ABC transporter ATP-binding protein n=1 Tax=Ancylobacter sp. WKF20 TaxID=3039801 RepID=UPI0024342EBE|nr:ABC transporter ATP-binding protein [Ancylobacter sp. WKF20]WGD29848.1 ABC transporter ATP-binding protein [Ancylobacter sp. WKF20]
MKISGFPEFWSLLSRTRRREFVVLLGLQFILSVLEFFAVGAVPAYVLLISRSEEIMAMPRVSGWLNVVGIDDVTTLLYVGGLGLIALFLLRGLFNLIVLKVQSRFMASIGGDVSLQLFTAYLHAPYLFHLTRNSAHFVHLVINETVRMGGNYLLPLLTAAQALFIIIALTLLVLVADPMLALVLGVTAGGACFLFVRTKRETLGRVGAEVSLRNRLLTQTLNEGLGSFKHTRLRALEGDVRQEFEHHAEVREEAQRTMRFNQGLSKPVFETVGLTALILLVFVMLLQGRSPDLVVPTLALMGSVAVRMLPTLNQLAVGLNTMRSNTATLVNLVNEYRVLGIGPDEPSFDAAATTKPLAMGDIVFTDVTYRYPGQNHDALQSLSLTIPAGSSVAFVGPTGSGKTTAIDVMLGFLAYSGGDITVGGRSIRENMAGWQRLIGYIPQAIYLTDASIRRNVALGVPEDEIDDAAIWRALEAAQLADYIRGLPEGLQTNVGERGVRLSGGQRQRVGIARALYFAPEVLILDEATAALDNATERRLMAAIEKAKSGRTLVMIAHRLSTVRNCDRIFFIKAGLVAATGTYDELIENCPEFRDMAYSGNSVSVEGDLLDNQRQ